MEGNAIDCGRNNPEWAAVSYGALVCLYVSYGALVCLYCSGNHRSLGVNVSTVRSITMDHWSADEILKVLEGGNRQLHTFYQGHSLYLDSSTPQ
jgi:ADP-ribosylation factor GTPase-activating protein 1